MASTPDDFAQVEPDELFPSNNIRFVMWETAKLTERVDGLTKAIDKLGPAFETALEKHALDVKERIVEIKTGSKEAADKLDNMKESIDSFKGAMKVFGGIYAFALVIMAALLAWYLKPAPPSPAQIPPTVESQQVTTSEPSGLNSN